MIFSGVDQTPVLQLSHPAGATKGPSLPAEWAAAAAHQEKVDADKIPMSQAAIRVKEDFGSASTTSVSD